MELFILLTDIKELEDNCEKIINYENEWQKADEERKNREKLLGNRIYIDKVLKKQEVEDLNSSIKIIENNYDKSGFFVNLQNYSAKEKIKKVLEIKDFEPTQENTARLKDELSYAKIERRLKLYETEIQKPSFWGTITSTEVDDAYYDLLDQYNAKVERDEIREYLSNTEMSVTNATIYYLTEKAEKTIINPKTFPLAPQEKQR